MTAEQFAYWLQGYSEIASEAPTAEQWQVIQDHLATVFDKVTPYRGLSAAGGVIAACETARTLC